MDKSALWFGRFQPPTLAHLAALKAILGVWELVTLGLVDRHAAKTVGKGRTWAEYHALMNRTSYAAGKNPFTAEEVRAMWLAAIERADLVDRVQPEILPRPECWPSLNSTFPPRLFDYVQIIGSVDGAVEDFRRTHGSSIFGRPLSWIESPIALHNSEIRHRIASGAGRWQDYLPEGAYNVFVELDGPARMGMVGTEALRLRD